MFRGASRQNRSPTKKNATPRQTVSLSAVLSAASPRQTVSPAAALSAASRRLLLLLFAAAAALPPASRAADVTKADNGLPLNDSASWSAGIFPGTADRAVFPAPSADTAAELGADAAWNGILADPAEFAWTLNGPAALTLGSGGITANRTLTLGETLALGLSASQTWTVALSNTLAAAGTLSGPSGVSLTKSGPGSLFLSGDNAAFTGTFTLGNNTAFNSATETPPATSAGFVYVAHNNALGSGPVAARGAQLRAAVPGLTLSNPFTTGSGSLRFSGVHDLTIDGPITVDAGASRGLGNYSSSAVLRLAGPLIIGTANTAITFEGVANATFDLTGPLTGAGKLAINISGANARARLSNPASAFTGTVEIAVGIIEAAHPDAFGTPASITLLNNGSILDLADGIVFTNAVTTSANNNYHTLRIAPGAASAEFTGPILDKSTGTNAFRFTVPDPAQTLTVSGPLSSASAASLGFQKYGPGTLYLPNAQSFTSPFRIGDTKINESPFDPPPATTSGILLIGHPDALGLGLLIGLGAQLRAAVPGLTLTNDITLDGGGLRFGGIHDLTLAGAVTITNTVGGRDIYNHSGSHTLTFAGPVHTGDGGQYIQAYGTQGSPINGATVFSGPLHGGGFLNVNIPNGSVTLAGPNTFTNYTRLSDGTLRLDYTDGDTSKLSDTAPLIFAGGAALELHGGSHLETVSSTIVSNPAAITRVSGAAVLALGELTAHAALLLSADDIASTTSTNAAGVLPGVFIRTPSGDILPAAASDASDGLDGHFIRAADPAALTLRTTAITRLGGVIPDDPGLHALITEGGIEGPVTFTALTNHAASLSIAAADGPVVVAYLPDASLNLGDGTSSFIALSADSPGLTLGETPGEGTLTAGGDFPALASLAVINANPDPAAAVTLNARLTDNPAVTETVTGEPDPDTGAVITNTVVIRPAAKLSLAKHGPGTLVLAAASAYTGATLIDEGTLRLAAAATLSAGPLRLNGALDFNRTADYTLPVAITGPGTLVKNGTATLTVSQNGTAFSGPVVINSGILKFQDNASDTLLQQTGTGPVTLNGGTLALAANGPDSDSHITTGDPRTGNIDITVTANATITVDNGNNAARLRNTLHAGALTLAGPATLAFGSWDQIRLAFDGPVTLNGPAVFNPTFADILTWVAFNAPITDNGHGFTHSGKGTLLFNTPNAVTGPVTLGAGTINNGNPYTSLSNSGIVLLNDDFALGTAPLTAKGAQFRAARPGIAITNNIQILDGGLRTGGTNDFALLGTLTPVNALRGFGNYSYTATVTLGDIDLSANPASFEGLNNGASNGSLRVAGVISGSKAITVATSLAPGRAILANDNTFTGSTTVQTGAILQFGDGGTNGSALFSALANNGTLAFNRSDTLTQGVHFAATWTGQGGLSQEGPGTLVLTRANTATGAVRIAAQSTLALAPAARIAPATPVTADGTLALHGPATFTAGLDFPAALSGSGRLLVAPGAILSVPGAATVPGLAFAPESAWRWNASPDTNDTLHVTGDLALDTLPLAIIRAPGTALANRVLITYGGAYAGPAEIPIPAHPGYAAVPDPETRAIRLVPLHPGTLILVK